MLNYRQPTKGPFPKFAFEDTIPESAVELVQKLKEAFVEKRAENDDWDFSYDDMEKSVFGEYMRASVSQHTREVICDSQYTNS